MHSLDTLNHSAVWDGWTLSLARQRSLQFVSSTRLINLILFTNEEQTTVVKGSDQVKRFEEVRDE